jgi:hypothetical protein
MEDILKGTFGSIANETVVQVLTQNRPGHKRAVDPAAFGCESFMFGLVSGGLHLEMI